MESRHWAVLLKQTLDPSTQAEAAAELDKVSKIIGFAPGILQVNISVLSSMKFKKLVIRTSIPH